MPHCVIKSCKNYPSKVRKEDGVSYFHFPRDPIRFSSWKNITAKSRQEEYFNPKKSNLVCSDHFTESDMYITNNGLRRLKKTAVPTLLLNYEDNTSHNAKFGETTIILVFKDAAAASASTAEPSASTAAVDQSLPSPRDVGDNEGAATVEEIIIKEEISEEEKKQCRLCLSVDRSLEELGEFAPLYRKLLFENYQNTTIPSFMYEMLACWECRAELRRIQKFQDKVRRANAAFETSQNQNCEDLSTLSAVLIGEPVAKTAPEQSEPATSLEECAQTIKEEEVEPPEVEETTLPDPLAVNLGVVKSSNEEVINIEFEREPKRSVKERAKPAQTRAKRAADVKETPTKRAKLARSGHEKTAGQDADDDTPLSQMTSQPHDVTVRADAPIDCDEIFGKVKIEFAELQCILSERRNKQSFKSMQYKCDSCVLGFTDQSRLQEHNSNFHNKNVGSCECDICERRFVDPEQLAAHYGNHFVKFVCKLCQFECYTKTGRVIHFKRHRDAHLDSVLRQRLAQASSSSE